MFHSKNLDKKRAPAEWATPGPRRTYGMDCAATGSFRLRSEKASQNPAALHVSANLTVEKLAAEYCKN
jgi:hypothetical protein